MSAFDGNRDGVLNNAERSDAREFAQGDRNHDGALNRAEFGRVDGRLSESDDEQRLSIANTLFSRSTAIQPTRFLPRWCARKS